MCTNGMHDPGVALAFVQLKPEQSIDDAAADPAEDDRSLAADPPTQEEVDRAKARILKNIELTMTDSQIGRHDARRYAGDGDWRSFFLNRDEVGKVTPADVTRVAKAYLKSSNRTLGEFIPTKTPDRAEIPATPDRRRALQGLQGRRSHSGGRNLRSRRPRTSRPASSAPRCPTA